MMKNSILVKIENVTYEFEKILSDNIFIVDGKLNAYKSKEPIYFVKETRCFYYMLFFYDEKNIFYYGILSEWSDMCEDNIYIMNLSSFDKNSGRTFEEQFLHFIVFQFDRIRENLNY